MEIVAVALLILVAVVLLKSVVIVRQGYEYTVENFGKFTRSLTPGFHVLIPVFESIGAKINRKEQVIEVASQEVITKDNAMVKVNGVLFYQIQDAVKAAYQVDDLDYAIIFWKVFKIKDFILVGHFVFLHVGILFDGVYGVSLTYSSSAEMIFVTKS